MSTVILGLGANVGDREDHLRKAFAAMKGLLDKVACSPVYESPALLPEGAPQAWNQAFLNMAVRGETESEPDGLLAQVKAIEKKLGREARGHWGPREIDIDILAYGDRIVAHPNLSIPHRALLQRNFALVPFADVMPEWVHPQAEGKTARALAAPLRNGLKRTDIVIP